MVQAIRDRSERGLALFEERGNQIRGLGEDLFEVSSSEAAGSEARIYNAHYGAGIEHCTCTDFAVHRGEISCKHLICIGIAHAAQRSGIREIRLPAVFAGDGIAHRGSAGETRKGREMNPWKYEDGELSITATKAGRESFRKTVREVGYVKRKEAVEDHAALAFRRACKDRKLLRLDKERQELYRRALEAEERGKRGRQEHLRDPSEAPRRAQRGCFMRT
jgi:hypothetical protein